MPLEKQIEIELSEDLQALLANHDQEGELKTGEIK